MDKEERQRLRELEAKATSEPFEHLAAARNALASLLDALDEAENKVELAEACAEHIKRFHEVDFCPFEAKLADARRTTLLEAAGWVEAMANELDAEYYSSHKSTQLHMVVEMLRERAKEVK